jgi:hypothetical protein
MARQSNGSEPSAFIPLHSRLFPLPPHSPTSYIPALNAVTTSLLFTSQPKGSRENVAASRTNRGEPKKHLYRLHPLPSFPQFATMGPDTSRLARACWRVAPISGHLAAANAAPSSSQYGNRDTYTPTQVNPKASRARLLLRGSSGSGGHVNSTHSCRNAALKRKHITSAFHLILAHIHCSTERTRIYRPHPRIPSFAILRSRTDLQQHRNCMPSNDAGKLESTSADSCGRIILWELVRPYGGYVHLQRQQVRVFPLTWSGD